MQDGTVNAPATAAGRLRLVQVLEDGKDGVEGLFGPAFSAVSPDGVHLYVTGYWGDTLVVFARDAQSGRLTFLEAHRNGVSGVDGLGNPTALAVSPDGAHVYATGFTANAVTAFQRDPATGRLTRLASWRDGVDGVQGLDGAFGIALSADAASVYVASYYGHSVAVFARDAGTGTLSFVQAVRSGAAGVRGLTGARGVVVSPDGAHLWTAARADKSIALFSRDTTTGRLGFVEARRDVMTEWIGMGDVIDPVLSPNGRHLYQTSLSYNALLVFSTDEGGLAPIVRCAGDCDENARVTVAELVKGVNIALGTAPLSVCEMFDLDGNRRVAVNELIRGVNNTLKGCVDPPTPGDHRRTLLFGGNSRIYDVHMQPVTLPMENRKQATGNRKPVNLSVLHFRFSVFCFPFLPWPGSGCARLGLQPPAGEIELDRVERLRPHAFAAAVCAGHDPLPVLEPVHLERLGQRFDNGKTVHSPPNATIAAE